MIKLSAFALLGAMTFTTAAQMHRPDPVGPAPALSAAIDDPVGGEDLTIYYSPLESTRVASYVGLGMAYHMAIVYTDRTGASRGVSAGPSDLAAPQTPEGALSAVVASFDERPSTFGTLAADPSNGARFTRGTAADYFTKDGAGHAYPSHLALRGNDLSARWASILATYARADAMKLTYSHVTQNSNSVAGTALRRAGIDVDFSSKMPFVPGAFTQLP